MLFGSVPFLSKVFLLENKKCGRQQIGTPWWKVHLANNLLFDHLVFSAFAHVRTERELIMHPSFFCSCSSMNRTLQQQIDQHISCKNRIANSCFQEKSSLDGVSETIISRFWPFQFPEDLIWSVGGYTDESAIFWSNGSNWKLSKRFHKRHLPIFRSLKNVTFLEIFKHCVVIGGSFIYLCKKVVAIKNVLMQITDAALESYQLTP